MKKFLVEKHTTFRKNVRLIHMITTKQYEAKPHLTTLPLSLNEKLLFRNTSNK